MEKKIKRRRPSFDEERKLWKKGYDFVIGVDEVGRGAFAGPVTVGAVVFDKNTPCTRGIFTEINDSKLLSPRKRQILSLEIKRYSLGWEVSTVGVSKINKKGIGKTTQIAFRKAIQKAIKILRYKDTKRKKDKSPNILISQYPNIFVLIDGFHIRYLREIGLKNQKAIIKGDQKSVSIAAASIIAKVHRDNLMKRLHKKFPSYNFAKNKGYGTKEHIFAIKTHGLSKIHRTSFSLDKFTQYKPCASA